MKRSRTIEPSMSVRPVAIGLTLAAVGCVCASACSFALNEVKRGPQDAGADGSNPIIVKAFPSAEGFGTTTVGGRGGNVVFVDNLADSGAGSLRQALELATGPRTVIFRVAGTIVLTK